jgi:3-methyladenine DNA glycosylase AlkD
MSKQKELQEEIRKKKNAEKAKILQRFFKTGKGEYGEGDRFLGITVPILRKTVKPYCNLELCSLESLIQSAFHEERLGALLILVEKYKKEKSDLAKKRIYDFYCSKMQHINNWDLVDLTAPHIAGDYLFQQGKKIPAKWIKNKNLWARRIAIVSTFYFIREDCFEETTRVAECLLGDEEDLIHKAVGWMLREVGKRNMEREEAFLKKHYKKMPRTMLRYAIERFPEELRQKYLRGNI